MLLLGEEDPIAQVAAFSAQVQSHLPPVDTVNAALRTKGGVTGWLAMSYGTTFDKFEFSVACEKGVVTVTRGKVFVKKVGEEVEEVLFPDDKAGVVQEVEGFAQALVRGQADERQTPELALKDLELVSLYIFFFFISSRSERWADVFFSPVDSSRNCWCPERGMPRLWRSLADSRCGGFLHEYIRSPFVHWLAKEMLEYVEYIEHWGLN